MTKPELEAPFTNEIISILSKYNKESILHLITYTLYLMTDVINYEKAIGLRIHNITLDQNYRFIDGRYNSICFMKYGICNDESSYLGLLFLLKITLTIENNSNSEKIDFIVLFNLLKRIKKFFNDLFTDNLVKDNTLELKFQLLAQYLAIFNLQAQPQLDTYKGLQKFSRSYLMLKRVQEYEQSNKTDNFKVIDYFKSIYDYEIEHIIILLVNFYSHFHILNQQNLFEKDMLLNFKFSYLPPEGLLDKIYSLLASPIEDFQKYNSLIEQKNRIDCRSIDELIFFKPLPLYLKPLIELTNSYDQKKYCLLPFANLLAVKVYEGLYFDIFDSLNTQQRDQFTKSMGKVFENYVGYLLKRSIFRQIERLEGELENRPDNVKSVDWYIIKGDKIILLECKFAFYSVLNRSNFNTDYLKSYLQRTFIKNGSNQLFETENNIKNKSLALFQEKFPEQYTKIYRVIVTAETLNFYFDPICYTLFKTILKDLNPDLNPDLSDYIDKITILDIELLENILIAGSQGADIFEMFDIIEGKNNISEILEEFYRINNIVKDENNFLIKELDILQNFKPN